MLYRLHGLSANKAMFTRDNILRIEQELKITLPADYKSVLLAYPFSTDSDFYDCDLLGNAEALVNRNQGHRENGYFGQDWPRHYFTIGDDGTDNDYFLDLSKSASPVYLADHERTAKSKRLEFEETASDISAFIILLKEQAAESEQEERQDAERRKHRKWWQFWL